MQDKVRDRIESAMLSGQLSPGDKLDERELAAEFATSRTPVREALLVLAAQGLVVIAPRSGIFVRRASTTELVAMFEMLAELEGVVARLATQRMGEAERTALQEAHCEASLSAQAADTPRYVEANRVFHEVLYAAVANPYMIDEIRFLRRTLALYWRNRGLISPARVQSSCAEHARVVEAVLASQPEQAADAMRMHISAGGKAVVDLVLQVQG